MKNRLRMIVLPLSACVPWLIPYAVAAESPPAPPQEKLETQKLTDSLYLITGPGGNIALSVGADGVFLVDDQIAPMTPALKKAVASVTPRPVRIIFNTHWHGDHTGGNAVLGGEGAVIVAHDNVRKRLAAGQLVTMMKRPAPPAPPAALPVITFADTLAFHLNGDDIEVTHVDPAHTDGDSFVFFKKANVLHMGDTFFSGGYPVIDVTSGGSIDGYVKAADRALALAQPSTKIIPGHGAVVDREKLKTFRDMLATIRDRVKKLAAAGKSLAEVQAAKPTADYDAAWGGSFIGGPRFVEMVYESVSQKR